MVLQSRRASGEGYHPRCRGRERERERERQLNSFQLSDCVFLCACVTECSGAKMTDLLGPLNAPDRPDCIYCKRGLVRKRRGPSDQTVGVCVCVCVWTFKWSICWFKQIYSVSHYHFMCYCLWESCSIESFSALATLFLWARLISIQQHTSTHTRVYTHTFSPKST